jgi:hypothetical protein
MMRNLKCKHAPLDKALRTAIMNSQPKPRQELFARQQA